MQASVLVLALLVGTTAAASTEQNVTPIQKVIQMLTDMKAKGKAEKEDEAKGFAEYKTWCKDTAWDKSTAIKTAKSAIDELTADIGKASADVLEATKAIAANNEDLSSWEFDVKKNTDIRKEANSIFKETHADYTTAIDAVDRALSTLKAGPSFQQTQTSLLELSSMGRMSAQDRTRVMSFLQKGEPTNALLQDAEQIEQPQAKQVAYSSSSGGVIEMVEKLGEKFEQERADLEKKEATESHSHNMIMADLERSIASATEERDSKMGFKAKREADKSDAEGDLSDTKATMAEDEKFLSDLSAECEQKNIDFEQRQKVRQEELEAIQQAIDIMSSDKVSGASFVQQGASALVQLRSSSQTRQSYAQSAVATFLQDRAQRSDSRILSLLAVKVSADPFKKVVKMIKDMITKLVEEANEEAEHKGFCDKEMGENKATRDSKTEEAALLKATIEELTADIAKLAEDIGAGQEEITAIDAAVNKATSDRATEKEKNTVTIADAKAGKAAVGQALKVLKDFYDKAATSTALVQQPETFDKPYTGMAGGGVLGMLEVCESDFARLESETTSGEAESAKVYEEFMADSSEDKDTKTKAVKDKTSTQQQKESALAGAKKDLTGVQEELDAALAYFDKLKPSCVDAGETYEERVQRRKEEIESLQEALKILNGDAV